MADRLVRLTIARRDRRFNRRSDSPARKTMRHWLLDITSDEKGAYHGLCERKDDAAATRAPWRPGPGIRDSYAIELPVYAAVLLYENADS